MYGATHGFPTPKLNVKSASIAFGGSFASWSVTCAATTVTAQFSPNVNETSGSSVNVVGPPPTVAVCAPLVVHEIVNHDPDTFTGSLKVIEMFVPAAASVAPLPGVVVDTPGAASVHALSPAQPSPSKVSVAKPCHCTAGSNRSVSFASAASIARRRSVLSIVLVRSVPHWTPGSKPTLADRVDDDSVLAEEHGVVAVEPARVVRLVRSAENGLHRLRLCEHEHVARRDGSDQRDRQVADEIAVGAHLHVVDAVQRHRGRARIVDLERLVVARALDVLGEVQVGGYRACARNEQRERYEDDQKKTAQAG